MESNYDVVGPTSPLQKDGENFVFTANTTRNEIQPEKVTLIMGERIEIEKAPASTNTGYKYHDYDPYDYCTSQKPTTYWDAFVHLLKSVLGSGIFVMPNAFKEVGYAVGIVGVVCATVIYTYCTHLLVVAEYELCKRRRIPHLTYSNTAYAAFRDGLPNQKLVAKTAKYLVNVLFIMLEASSCSCNLIFMAGNVKQLFDHYFGYGYDIRIFMIFVTIPIIFVCWIRTLKSLATFSAAANFVIFICFAGIIYYVFRETPTLAGKVAVKDLTKIPVFFSTVSFSIACIGVVMPLKAEMSKPSKFSSLTGVLNMSMIPVTLFYVSVGFFGYLKYGDAVADSITLNLPQEEFLCQFIILLFSFPVLISYSLNYYVVLDIVWTNYLKRKFHENKLMWDYIARMSISIITLLMAAAIPDLGKLVSLVGALGIGTNGLVLPVVMHTLVFWKQHKFNLRFFLFLFKNLLLFLLSMYILSMAVTISVKEVISLYH